MSTNELSMQEAIGILSHYNRYYTSGKLNTAITMGIMSLIIQLSRTQIQLNERTIDVDELIKELRKCRNAIFPEYNAKYHQRFNKAQYNKIQDDSFKKLLTMINGMADVECNMYDKEEIHENCTVQIWSNSATGKQSIGWWKND